MYNTFTTVQDDFVTDTIASYNVRGYHSYKISSDDSGTWLGTEYITVIGGHSVSIKVAEDFEENLNISFSVDGECDLFESTGSRKAITRWLLAMWQVILSEYNHTITLDVYTDDNNGEMRDAWYSKLGFVSGEYGDMIYNR